MAFLYNKLSRQIILSLIVLWSTVSFFYLNQIFIVSIIIILLSTLSCFFIWYEILPIFLLIFTSFVISFSLYGFLVQYGFPVWFVMIAILLLFGYTFVYIEQKIGILGNKRLIYLLLFSMIILELFLTLHYFLISPLSKSLIISAMSYMLMGFCYSILAKNSRNTIKTYITISSILVFLILASSSWGSGI